MGPSRKWSFGVNLLIIFLLPFVKFHVNAIQEVRKLLFLIASPSNLWVACDGLKINYLFTCTCKDRNLEFFKSAFVNLKKLFCARLYFVPVFSIFPKDITRKKNKEMENIPPVLKVRPLWAGYGNYYLQGYEMYWAYGNLHLLNYT